MVYAASSLSLAALEIFVHLDPDEMPDDLVSISVDVPDDVRLERVEIQRLPRGWREFAAPEALQDLGSEWLRAGRSAALVVPSAVVPQDSNVLLNPLHADFRRLHIGEPQAFHFDPRMWKRGATNVSHR